MGNRLANWSRNFYYSTTHVDEPQSVEEAQAIVEEAEKIRVVGSRHSFNRIADSAHRLLSLARLNRIVDLDRENHTVTVEGSMRYGELAQYLHREGYALHNMASLPHISVTGACSTATHGSGVKNGNLATAIRALEFITADGTLVTLHRDEDADRLPGAAVGLGAIGIITRITLDILPTFDVRQNVFTDMPFHTLKDNFDSIMSSAYSVSLFTGWHGNTISQVWVKSLVDGETPPMGDFYGAKPAEDHRHPLPDLSAENTTRQLGIPGPWHERLPHFRTNFTPSSGDELQSEYFIPREHAHDALVALRQIQDQIAPLIYASEIRTIAADNLWMSPCYQQDCIGIHLTWKMNWDAVQQVLPVIEAQLEPFEPRPHWGKLFTISPATVQSRFPRLADFRDLLSQYDPNGKFRNDFIDTFVFDAIAEPSAD